MGCGFQEGGFTFSHNVVLNLGRVTLSFEILPADWRVDIIWMAGVFNDLEKLMVWLAVVVIGF